MVKPPMADSRMVTISQLETFVEAENRFGFGQRQDAIIAGQRKRHHGDRDYKNGDNANLYAEHECTHHDDGKEINKNVARRAVLEKVLNGQQVKNEHNQSCPEGSRYVSQKWQGKCQDDRGKI